MVQNQEDSDKHTLNQLNDFRLHHMSNQGSKKVIGLVCQDYQVLLSLGSLQIQNLSCGDWTSVRVLTAWRSFSNYQS